MAGPGTPVNSAGPTRWRLELGAQGELPALPGDRDGVLRIACGDVVLAVLAAGSVPTLWGPPRLVVRDELGEELVLEGDDRGPTADWVAEWLPERPGPYEVFVLYPGLGENEEMLDVAAPTWQLVVEPVLRIKGQHLPCRSVVQLTVLSRLAGPIEHWPETLAPQHDELYSHILRRRGGLQAKTSAEVLQSAGAATRFPYTEGGFCSSPAAVYWAWFQLAIGQRLAAAATASKISVSDVLADPSAAGIIRFAEKLRRPLSACEKAHLAAVPAALGYNMIHFTPIQKPGESGSCYALDDQVSDGAEVGRTTRGNGAPLCHRHRAEPLCRQCAMALGAPRVRLQ
eukprot:s1862_g7.t1